MLIKQSVCSTFFPQVKALLVRLIGHSKLAACVDIRVWLSVSLWAYLLQETCRFCFLKESFK